jgi:hypothetical protein
MKKTKTQTKISPSPATPTDLKTFVGAMTLMAVAIGRGAAELNRVKGVLAGVNPAADRDDIDHRVRSLCGHRKALEQVKQMVDLFLEWTDKAALELGHAHGQAEKTGR